MRTLHRTLLVVALTAFGMEAQAQGANAGQVSGRVTHAQGGQPIVGAQVRITGTNLGAVTDDAGQYTIRLVPPGDVALRVTRIGFAEQTRTVNVAAGATATADFAIAPVAIQLAEVVTTATGEQRRVEVANAVTRVDAVKAVETGAIQNIGQVLATRAPGVQVLQGGLVGAGTRIRVRGTSSLSLSNEPIYVIDGIRVEAGASSQSPNTVGGGTTPSRINDINPEEIETIDVVRGPSAATLYGTDAANGVIVITTKRGRVGPPQVSAYGEEGMITDTRNYPANYSAWGAVGAPTAASTAGCFPARRAAGQCTRFDSLTVFNPAEDANTTPFKDGHRRQYGAQVAGGIAQIRYFLAGENETVDGTYTIPKFDLQRYAAQNIKARDEWLNPNRYNRKAGRANLDLSLSPKFDVAVHSGFTQSFLRLPNTENSIVGLGFNMLNGPGRRTANGGYANFTPGDIFQRENVQRVNRFIASAAPIYRPFTWLTARGNAGLDFTSRVDELLCRASTCPNFGTTREGFKQNDRTAFFNYTLDGNVSASVDVMPGLNSRSTVGAQFLAQDQNRNGSGASRLTPGGTTTTQGSIPFADEATTVSRTLGAFLEEQVSWQERLFVTGAVRADNSSAFGTDFGTVVYPKASISYVLSDEPFFPNFDFLNQLRIRSAYGASGVRPGTTDALPFYGATSVALGTGEQPGLFFSALGNLDLKPERSTEFEGGIDLTLFQNRANLELTYYNKVSKDALVQRPLPPSFGAGTGTAVANVSRFENLGRIDNHGWEWLVQTQIIDLPMVGFDLTVNGSHNTNKLVSLGYDRRGKPIPPIVGATIQQRSAYPLNGYWQRPYTFNDANRDGIIVASEITVADSFKYVGYSQPRLEMGITAGADFWNKQLRLQAVFDHKGGHYLYNNSGRFRCGSSVCKDLVDPNSPLDRQARAVATRLLGINTGFFEKADYTRLRELSLTFRAPDAWAQRLRTRGLSATLTGQNLALWTNYTGLDPESNYGQADVPNDFLTQAPLTTYVFRINVGF